LGMTCRCDSMWVRRYDRTYLAPDPGRSSGGMLFVAMHQINKENKELR
jgi:hypothetical protein